ncbi:calcium-binding protein [Phaeobacter italicus]|uniref:calcium-binding protein n=1 Tax=Phaeobacter italicus TaxID=481446 RepID=UPI001C943808|nr:calcium-binding protein [Phaeobacter italicus]MBY5978616.1 calcium-binding protein [Phaeobacter italicus]
MANINAESGLVIEAGTTSADQITLTDAISVNGNIDGNGGADTLILNAGADDFATLQGVALSYDDTTDTWTIGTASLTEGFTSVTLSDGITIEAGVETSGIINPSAGTADGSALALTASDYEWDGAAASVTAFTVASIVSVDGQDVATVGNNFVNADGAFEVSGANLSFTANTAAVAAQGNVGDDASFSYEVVVANAGGDTRTITVTFDETIPFTNGDDTWNAGTGAAADVNETSDFGGVDAGNDTFNGNDEANAITAGDGNDTIFGGNEDDILEGGAGENFIRGGNGDDTITTGNDGSNLGGGAGADNITGGNGNDTIFGGQGDDSSLDGGAGNDAINGGAGADTLIGGAGDDTLKGGDGDDRLEGTSGSNELRGGAGEDTVIGGTEDDIIYTSLGGDELTGGTGDDEFVLKAGTGATTITDFGTGNDKLNVEELGYNNLDDVLAVAYQTDAGVVIAIDADTTVTLTSVATLGALDAADFDFA